MLEQIEAVVPLAPPRFPDFSKLDRSRHWLAKTPSVRAWLQALHGVGFHEKPCAKHSLQLHLANSQTRSLEKAAYRGLKNTSKRKQLALCKFSTETLSNCKTAPAQGSGRTKKQEGLHIKSGFSDWRQRNSVKWLWR